MRSMICMRSMLYIRSMISIRSMLSMIYLILSVFSWFPFVGAYLRSFSVHFWVTGAACFRVMVIKLRPYTEEVILGKSKEQELWCILFFLFHFFQLLQYTIPPPLSQKSKAILLIQWRRKVGSYYYYYWQKLCTLQEKCIKNHISINSWWFAKVDKMSKSIKN